MTLDGSFSQIIASDTSLQGIGGVTQRMLFDKPLIDFIKSLNGPGSGSTKTYEWATLWGPTTWGGYYGRLEDGTPVDQKVWWNWVGTPSADQSKPGHGNDRNVMCIDAYKNGMAEVVAAPKSTSYEKYRNIPWLVQKVWGNYGNMPQLWITLLVDPSSGFVTTRSNQGFWIDANWLYKKVGVAQIQWRVPKPPL